MPSDSLQLGENFIKSATGDETFITDQREDVQEERDEQSPHESEFSTVHSLPLERQISDQENTNSEQSTDKQFNILVDPHQPSLLSTQISPPDEKESYDQPEEGAPGST